MATRTIKTCDKHADADPEDVVTADVTVSMAIDGTKFALDLCTECKIQWDAFALQARTWQEMAPEEAQATVPTERATPPKPSSVRSNRDENTAIRIWARNKGLEIGDRGRISNEVRTLYRSEQERKPTNVMSLERRK